MALETIVHQQTGFASMPIAGATQALPSSGILTNVISHDSKVVEITVQFTTAAGGVFVPGADTGDFSVTLWRQSVANGVVSYVQSETASGVKGYIPQQFDSMTDAGVCGVSIHAITPPVDIAATGFRVLARAVRQ
jgi:hypothetical protein